MKRFFIAINFPEKTKKEINEFQKNLNNYLLNVRWVKPQNLHLTLAFLGWLKSEEVDKLKQITKEVANQTAPFVLHPKGLGVFPDRKRAKVLWIGVEDEEILKIINQTLYRKLVQNNFKLDTRGFSPHITIARFKEKANEKMITLAFDKFKDSTFGKIKVTSIDIMESQLKKDGPVYRLIEKVILKIN